MYVARNKNGALYLYGACPKRAENCFYSSVGYWNKPIDRDSFPEVTWENSPVQVELKIAK